MKSIIGALVLMLVSISSFAAPLKKIECQLLNEFDRREGPIDSITTGHKGGTIFLVSNNGGVVLIYWSVYGKTADVFVMQNKHYPWNIPFQTKIFSKQVLRQNEEGQIEGLVDLSPIKPGYQLACLEVKT